jgi:uncharacterized repeat protein (TIGR04076 family)
MNEKEFWEIFQARMGYTDEELELFKSDPKHLTITAKFGMKLEEMYKKYLVFEVVKSEGCAEHMKTGDRIFFRGMARMDPERSDPWCIWAMPSMHAIASICHDRWVEGLDPNGMAYDHISCMDCGVKAGGWGHVAMKAYVVDESEL